jgi:ADP-heptose:LPS heptosyltransferase
MLRAEGLGDVVMLLPLLREIAAKYPDVAVDLVANSSVVGKLIEPEGLVRRILIRPSRLLSLDALRLVTRVAFRYDAAIQTWTSQPFRHKRVLFMRLSGARRRIGSSPEAKPVIGYTDMVPFNPDTHMVEGNIILGRVLFPKLEVVRPELHCTEAEESLRDDFMHRNAIGPGEVLGIHPGSGSGNLVKRWDIMRFVAVARNVLNDRLVKRVWVFLGPDEDALATEFQSLSGVTIIRGYGIRQVAALTSACKLFLTGDSGLGHVASAMAVPTVTVIGPGHERRIAPYGKDNVVVTADVPCRPCTGTPMYEHCPYGRRCLLEVTVEQVMSAIRSKWATE